MGRGKFVDITGQRFNRLTVIARAENSKRGTSRWVCQCDCGNVITTGLSHLKSGNTKSCGCLHRELSSQRGKQQYKDMTGQTFGRLTVIEKVNETTHGCVNWKCRCTCGNVVIARGTLLRNGHTQSCGCLARERAQVWLKNACVQKYNNRLNKLKYEFDGEIGKCYYTDDEYFLFDTEDYDKIKDYVWYKSARYITAFYQNHSEKLHRLIMDCPEGMVVDHINGNTSDNRKCNLRVCTQQQNSWNRTTINTNTSGYRGVTVIKRAITNKFRANIVVNGKTYHLGVFPTAEEAYEARLKAEKLYFGEFAPKEYDD